MECRVTGNEQRQPLKRTVQCALRLVALNTNPSREAKHSHCQEEEISVFPCGPVSLSDSGAEEEHLAAQNGS